MNLKFNIKETLGIPDAVFEEMDYKYYPIEIFLGEARPYHGFLYTEMIKEAEQSQLPVDTVIIDYTGDAMSVEFYSDRIVITELYPKDEDNPQSTTLSLQETKELLIQWQIALKEWYERRDRSAQNPGC